MASVDPVLILKLEKKKKKLAIDAWRPVKESVEYEELPVSTSLMQAQGRGKKLITQTDKDEWHLNKMSYIKKQN